MRFSYRYAIAALFVMTIFASCNLSKFPIDDPAIVKIDEHMIGKWREDRDSTIFTITRQDNLHYFINYRNRKKKMSEILPAFLSEVDNNWFLNIQYKEKEVKGYLFLKIINVNAAYDLLTIAMVKDTMLQHLKSASEVREYVKTNLNKPSFYGDTIKLRKLIQSNLSIYPINDPAKIKVDARLAGKWKVKEKEGSNAIYTFAIKDNYHYSVSIGNDKKKNAEKHTAFLSEVNYSWFMNFYSETYDDEGYKFYRFVGADPSYNKVTMVTVKDTSFKYLNSVNDVRSLVIKYLNDPEFYGDTLLMNRAK